MHAGTPIVMADVNGLGGLVEECGSGLSVPCEDPESLALAMSRVMEEGEDQASAWGDSGKAASRDYQWDRVTDRVLRVYRRVLGE